MVLRCHDYEPFDLLVGNLTPKGYPLTVVRAPAGDANGFCQIAPSEDELSRILAPDPFSGWCTNRG
jgi:hypothetical protein